VIVDSSRKAMILLLIANSNRRPAIVDPFAYDRDEYSSHRLSSAISEILFVYSVILTLERLQYADLSHSLAQSHPTLLRKMQSLSGATYLESGTEMYVFPRFPTLI
jgi:hypothetical protein